ncbi:MAG: flagellar basal body rod protein FlgC [Pelagimonas sp.]|jgi:flagellar basal-body rod protein FlgC|nr:flagellar basal body rod protein FlgC [Pelagimonas sp.]
MSAFSEALSVTSSGLKAQAERLRIVSENIANVDTPGYRRKVMSFQLEQSTEADLAKVTTGGIDLDKKELKKIFDPEHPLANADGFYESTNVDMIIEIADAREAQRSYEANLKMFQQTRDMSSGLMDLLRR